MSRFRRQSGAAAVEFAVVLPLLVMLVFGIIAFGIAFAQELALSNAARQGARYGVVMDRTCAQIELDVTDAVSTVGLGNNASSGNSDSLRVIAAVGSDDSSLAAPTCDSWSGGDDSVVPCAGSGVGENLYVQASADYQLTIPLVTDSNQPLTGLGAFRCEFGN